MQRIDGNYLYQVGHQIHPLDDFNSWGSAGQPATTYQSALLPLYVAESALEPLLTRSVFRLRTSLQAGHILLQAIRNLKAKIETLATDDERNANIDFFELYPVTNALRAFEAVLAAELALLPLYVVQPKAGFDTSILIESGARCFPDDVWSKAPDAIPDLMQGTKCIAFELFTAAGFHLHRANEAVLRRYWDKVTNGAARPKNRNMGDYLKQMDDLNAGDLKVKAALKDLKDLHRNPLIHPEHSLETADEAIALMNGVHTVMVYMLKEIPVVAPAPSLTPPGGVIPPDSVPSEIPSS